MEKAKPVAVAVAVVVVVVAAAFALPGVSLIWFISSLALPYNLNANLTCPIQAQEVAGTDAAAALTQLGLSINNVMKRRMEKASERLQVLSPFVMPYRQAFLLRTGVR